MKRNYGIVYRFYPTPEQERCIRGMFAAKRICWNKALEMYNEKRKYNKSVENPEDKIPYYLCSGNKTKMPNNELYGIDKIIEYANNKAMLESLEAPQGEDVKVKDFSWLGDRKKCVRGVYESVIVDLANAWERFYDYLEACKAGKNPRKVGVPSVKRIKDVHSVRIRNTNQLTDGANIIDWKRGLVKTPGFNNLGWCKCKLHRRFYGNVKYTTFSFDTDGKWYISLAIEEEVEEVKKPTNVKAENVIGIDVGLGTKCVAANAVDGDDDYKNYHPTRLVKELEPLEKRKKRIQRKMTRCIVTMTREGASQRSMTVKEMNKIETENKKAFSGYHKEYSIGYKKLAAKLSKLDAHMRRKREYWNHCFTSEIVSDPNVELIVTEDLAVDELMMRDKTKRERGIKIKDNPGFQLRKRKMRKHFSEFALGDVISKLEYKANIRGKGFQKVNRYFASSKTCSHCGEKYTGLTIRDRVWTCPHCGAEIKRDPNAAKNIAKKGLEMYNEIQSA